MGLVQFTNLDDMIAEMSGLAPGQPVRVAALEITEGAGQHGIRLAGIGVHVRAFDSDGHVLACYIPVARLQMMGSTVLADPGGENSKYNEACDKAEALKEEISQFLTDRGMKVAGGVIDIGDAKPLVGRWGRDGGS